MSRLADEIQRSISEKDRAIRTLQSITVSGFSSDANKVAIGSLVEVLNERKVQEFYFILPFGGGIEITENNRMISVITPKTPIAVALLDKRQGQSANLKIGSQQRDLIIVNIL